MTDPNIGDFDQETPGKITHAGVLQQVGPRLRQLRKVHGSTLAQLSTATGISVSTLSRLEAGGRKPTLELLLLLAREFGVALDELVGAPRTEDPRVQIRATTHNGLTVFPLTRRAGGVQAFKIVLERVDQPVDQQSHEGYEWLYVLSGRLRLVLAEHDLVLRPGEVVEFDTRTPHWFGALGSEPAEMLGLFGPQGERMHVRARPRKT